MQEHPELRAAAAELLLNLCHCEEGRRTQLQQGTDRLKLWLLYAASDEDQDDDDKMKSGRRLVRAAAGCLVLLTHDNKDVCVRLTKEVRCSPSFQFYFAFVIDLIVFCRSARGSTA